MFLLWKKEWLMRYKMVATLSFLQSGFSTRGKVCWKTDWSSPDFHWPKMIEQYIRFSD